MEMLFGKLPEFFKDEGVQELDQDKWTPHLRLKYNNSIAVEVALVDYRQFTRTRGSRKKHASPIAALEVPFYNS